MIKDFSKIPFLLILAFSLVLTSCDDDDDEDDNPTPPAGPTENIVEIAQGSDDFDILVEALVAGGLDDDLQTDGPFTVFAPTDAAFEALFSDLGVQDVDGLINELGAETVIDILQYHVVAGQEIRAADVSAETYEETLSDASPGANALSLLAAPANNTVDLNGGSGTEKGATVATANILATNGVIHAIDKVLLLPTVLDFAIGDERLSSLESAVVDAQLTGALGDENSELTVFAPLNDGFVDEQNLTDDLEGILLYHVLNEQLRSPQVVGEQTTLQGGTIDIAVQADETTVSITDATGDVIDIVLVDIQGINGVVHVIEDVLRPE